MEHREGGGESREQKGCGVTDSAITLTIPSKNCFIFHLYPKKSESPYYMSSVTLFS